jgi:hypothetical protein
MALLPHRRSRPEILRDIRSIVAQNETDIQRLWKLTQRAEARLGTPAYAVPIVGESSSSVSSSSSSCSTRKCGNCCIPDTIYATVTHISGPTRNDLQALVAASPLTMTWNGTRWTSTCVPYFGIALQLWTECSGNPSDPFPSFTKNYRDTTCSIEGGLDNFFSANISFTCSPLLYSARRTFWVYQLDITE